MMQMHWGFLVSRVVCSVSSHKRASKGRNWYSCLCLARICNGSDAGNGIHLLVKQPRTHQTSYINLMSGKTSHEFLGEPLEGSSKKTRFYQSFRGPNIEARCGDIVQVERHDGVFIGIIIALWEEGIRKTKQLTEILWFISMKGPGKQEVRQFHRRCMSSDLASKNS